MFFQSELSHGMDHYEKLFLLSEVDKVTLPPITEEQYMEAEFQLSGKSNREVLNLIISKEAPNYHYVVTADSASIFIETPEHLWFLTAVVQSSQKLLYSFF